MCFSAALWPVPIKSKEGRRSQASPNSQSGHDKRLDKFLCTHATSWEMVCCLARWLTQLLGNPNPLQRVIFGIKLFGGEVTQRITSPENPRPEEVASRCSQWAGKAQKEMQCQGCSPLLTPAHLAAPMILWLSKYRKEKQPRIYARMKSARSTSISGWLNKRGHTPRKATLSAEEPGQRAGRSVGGGGKKPRNDDLIICV